MRQVLLLMTMALLLGACSTTYKLQIQRTDNSMEFITCEGLKRSEFKIITSCEKYDGEGHFGNRLLGDGYRDCRQNLCIYNPHLPTRVKVIIPDVKNYWIKNIE